MDKLTILRSHYNSVRKQFLWKFVVIYGIDALLRLYFFPPLNFVGGARFIHAAECLFFRVTYYFYPVFSQLAYYGRITRNY